MTNLVDVLLICLLLYNVLDTDRLELQ